MKGTDEFKQITNTEKERGKQQHLKYFSHYINIFIMENLCQSGQTDLISISIQSSSFFIFFISICLSVSGLYKHKTKDSYEKINQNA